MSNSPSANDVFEPASIQPINNRQRLFVRYLLATLIDLVVLNLFAEYYAKVSIDSFTVSLFAAIVLQILLKATIALEHAVAEFFNRRRGTFARFLRYFSAWLILFGSKFVILEAITFAFGDDVHFAGAFHGVVTLILVIVAMLAAEEVVVRIYRRLA